MTRDRALYVSRRTPSPRRRCATPFPLPEREWALRYTRGMPEDTQAHDLVPVELTILGARIRGEAKVPAAAVALEELLPVFRMVMDAVVKISVKSVEQHGK